MIKQLHLKERITLAFHRAMINAGLRKTHDIDLIQDDGKVHVYSDGSYGWKTGKLGMGWVVKTSTPNDEILFHDNADKIQPPPHTKEKNTFNQKEFDEEHQNAAAEIMAATHALNTISEPSDIELHTDFGEIIAFIQNGTIQPTAKIKTLSQQWNDLRAAIERHKSISVIYSCDREHDKKVPYETKRIMRLAHNLAATGSGASTQKPLYPEDKEKYAGLFKDHTIDKKDTPTQEDAFLLIDLNEGDDDDDLGLFEGWGSPKDDPQPY